MTRTTAGVVLAAALASAAAGQAIAAPAPGTAPPSNEMAPGTAPESAPGTAPGTAPATPTPQPPPPPARNSIIPAPTYDAPVIYEDSPGYTPPVYSGTYNPIPPQITAPRRVAPVNPILPRPGTIKLGNFRAPQPGWLSDADARNLNGQAATIEARVATYYESIGFPKDQAARTAASTTLGILVGGATGAAIGAVPGAIIGLPVGAGVGAITGLITGATLGAVGGTVVAPGPGSAAGAAALAGPGAGIGALVGLGVGPVVGGLGGAALGGLIGGGIGGAIGYAVGAGDPGGNPNAPIGGATNEDPRKSKPAPPNPDANQYELHGRGIDYVVAKNGDVSGSVKLGAANIPISIDHDAADAPYKAAGVFAQTARDSVTAAVVNFGKEAQKAFPGLKIDYPQYASTSVGGKHRK
ncbi:hypothetical protein [uncultured Williamsia sp.]|uniref:hypothetical protein n=1 Tax=uncultured Williamsia sp. TaxID=259311 RepID=UPI002604FEAE|nr:hypothetical protein [uncultured Williamsia sp.]